MRGFVFFHPWLAEWEMLNHIRDGQDVLSQEKRWEPGSQQRHGPYGEKGVWSNGRSVSALHRMRQNKNRFS